MDRIHPLILNRMKRYEWLLRYEEARQRDVGANMMAFYSSYVGGVTTDPELMFMPIDDHLVHRGYGVYDTCSVVNSKLYRLENHLNRLRQSCENVQLKFPPNLRDLISDTLLISEASSGQVRVYISSGCGDFSIHSNTDQDPLIYILIYKNLFPFPALGEPVSEVTVQASEVPMKTGLMSRTKTVNYLPNSLMADTAKARGGLFGIWLDDRGSVTEGSIDSVCIVKNGVMIGPLSENILAGTTMKRICDVAVRQGFVKEVTSMKMTREDLYQADEVIITASDIHINPVTTIDGKSINHGNIGQVCKGIVAYMQDELSHY